MSREIYHVYSIEYIIQPGGGGTNSLVSAVIHSLIYMSISYSDSSTSEHTICSHPSNKANNDTDVIMYMDVFTSNMKAVDYSFTFNIVDDFKLE